MNDLTIKTDLSIQMKSYVEGVELFRQHLHDWDAGHVEDVKQTQIQLELLEKAAQQAKLLDLQKEVAVAKVEIARWFGKHFEEIEEKVDLGLDRSTKMRYKHVADVPAFVFDYAVESTVYPSVNKILSERKRYIAIQKLVEKAGVKSSVAKRMMKQGYSVIQAEKELFGGDEDVDLGVDMTDDTVDFLQTFDVEAFDDAVSMLETQLGDLRDMVIVKNIPFTTDLYKISVYIASRLKKTTSEMLNIFKEIKKELG